MSAIEALDRAIKGESLDVALLEKAELEPETTRAQAPTILPLLVALAERRPEVALEIPETFVDLLFQGVAFHDVLKLTKLDSTALRSPLVRPLLLKQLSRSGTPSDYEFSKTALPYLADPELETSSVSYLEKLLVRVPEFTEFVPFQNLFNGSAELKGRLMSINLELLANKNTRKFVPLNYLVWPQLENPETGDILLFALQVDYIGSLAQLVSKFSTNGNLEVLENALTEICNYYTNTEDSFMDSAIEKTLASVAKANVNTFFVFDDKFKLVNAERFNLMAQLPARYIIDNHKSIVENLELRNNSLAAVSNISQESDGLKLLPLTQSRLNNMPAPSQLMLAACATVSEEGARYFADRYMDSLKVAYSVPDNSETSDLLATLRANVNRWKLKIPRDVAVTTA